MKYFLATLLACSYSLTACPPIKFTVAPNSTPWLWSTNERERAAEHSKKKCIEYYGPKYCPIEIRKLAPRSYATICGERPGDTSKGFVTRPFKDVAPKWPRIFHFKKVQ